MSSSRKKRGRKTSDDKVSTGDDSSVSVYNSALESLSSSPAVSLCKLSPTAHRRFFSDFFNILHEFILDHNLISSADRSLSEGGSGFATPVASGTPLATTADASSKLIAGEREQQQQQQQQHSSSGGKKELLNQFDAAEDSNGGDMSSFIDLSNVSVDTNSDTISRNSDSIYSINSTPEKLNIPSPAPNSDTLEEIVVISSEGTVQL